MAKFNINSLMNEQSKIIKTNNDFEIVYISIEDIEPSPMNRYNTDDIEELKATIEMLGLQQNLLVRKKENCKYEIISGHRRYKAAKALYSEGDKRFERLPCKIIESDNDIKAELQLLFANATARKLTDWEKTYQAGRIKELLEELKKSGYKFTGRTRETVANLLKVSPSQIGRMESINNKLIPELKEEFKEENINITTAYELSKLDDTKQQEALQEHKKGAELKPEVIKAHKVKPSFTPDHSIKIHTEPFEAVVSRVKTFEYRLNDRNYKTGDTIRLNEYLPQERKCTGKYIDVRVIYTLLGGSFGVPEGYVIMSIRVIGGN